MRRGVLVAAALLAPLLVFGAGGDDAAAGQKKPSPYQAAKSKCDLALVNCDCTYLIDIGSAIADCEKKCQRNYDRCLRTAGKKPKPQ
jgi:hypothetical protein